MRPEVIYEQETSEARWWWTVLGGWRQQGPVARPDRLPLQKPSDGGTDRRRDEQDRRCLMIDAALIKAAGPCLAVLACLAWFAWQEWRAK